MIANTGEDWRRGGLIGDWAELGGSPVKDKVGSAGERAFGVESTIVNGINRVYLFERPGVDVAVRVFVKNGLEPVDLDLTDAAGVNRAALEPVDVEGWLVLEIFLVPATVDASVDGPQRSEGCAAVVGPHQLQVAFEVALVL